MKRYNYLLAWVAIVVVGAFWGKAKAQPMPSGTLPVFYLDTYKGEEIKKRDTFTFGHATYRLDVTDRAGIKPSSGSIIVSTITDLSMSNEQKKSIAFELDFKADLLGTGKGAFYCLLPYTEDRYAFLCHAVGFELSRRIGLAWTPHMIPVELVLNGEYWGIYFLTEQLEVSPNRVNVERLHGRIISLGSMKFDLYYVTGGWLFASDPNTAASWCDDIIPHVFKVYNPNYRTEPISSDSEDYLMEVLDYRLTHRTIPEIPNSDEWEDYIDMDTLACYYIVNELMDNIKGFHYNCWMHKHRGEETKLLFGPVWDFGTAFTREPAQMDFIYNQIEPELRAEIWISKIVQSPRFQECLRRHYTKFKEKNGIDLDVFIDGFIDEIEAGVEADFKRWPDLGKQNLRDEAQLFKNMFKAKEAFLDSQWLKK